MLVLLVVYCKKVSILYCTNLPPPPSLPPFYRKDLLFVLIGTTNNAAIHTLFEKRIISRRNAQYVYLPCPSAEDICQDMSKKMTLLLLPSSGSSSGSRSGGNRRCSGVSTGTDSDSNSDSGSGSTTTNLN